MVTYRRNRLDVVGVLRAAFQDLGAWHPQPLLAAVPLLFAVLGANGAQGGGIAGRLTDSVGDPVVNVSADLYETTSGGLYWYWTRSGSVGLGDDGRYRIDGLASGTYRICFSSLSDANYAFECYDDAPEIGSATSIAVTAGETVSNIDAELATGGVMEGRLMDGAGDPVTGVTARSYRWNGDDWAGSFFVSPGDDGRYRIKALASGTYRVCFRADSDANYLFECYADAPDIESAADITVTAGETISNIDAVLAQGAVIEGRVTDGAGDAVASVVVPAFLWNGHGWGYSGTVGFLSPPDDGYYRLGSLASGTYRVCFSPSGNYAPECYDDAADIEGATDISVGAGETASNIDAQLEVGGAIEGRVTNSSDVAVTDVKAVASRWDGDSWELVDQDFISSGDDGLYRIDGLATGTYQVCFYAASNYVDECYDDAPNRDSATTDIAVTAGETAPNIDAELATGGAIVGRLSDGTGGPITDARARMYKWNGTSWALAGSDFSVWPGDDGLYRIDGLTTDSYRVCFEGSSYVFECYDDAPSIENATDIAVTAGETASNIDAELASIRPLDVDANGVVDALTDGLLVIRHLFGLSGSALVQDALASDARHRDPLQIGNSINALGSQIDVDLSGSADALTDGLLIIRHLFGLSGAALVQDALAPSATRMDPAEIAVAIEAMR